MEFPTFYLLIVSEKYCLFIFLVILSLVEGKHVGKLLRISLALQGNCFLRKVVKSFLPM